MPVTRRAHRRMISLDTSKRAARRLTTPRGTQCSLCVVGAISTTRPGRPWTPCSISARSVSSTALDRGLALILRQRLEALPCNTSWASQKILGPVSDRAARAKDDTQAAILREQFSAASEDDVDVEAAIDALDALFPCP